jgi:acyl-coenzyme A thioesterase PaaI-like protein
MARARVIHAGMTQATCQCDVYVTDGNAERLVAVAQGTINRIGEGASEPMFNA